MTNIKDAIDIRSIQIQDGGALRRTLTARLLVSGSHDSRIDSLVGDVVDHFEDYLNSQGFWVSCHGHGGQHEVNSSKGRYSVAKGFPVQDLKRVNVQIIPAHDADLDVVSGYATYIKTTNVHD